MAIDYAESALNEIGASQFSNLWYLYFTDNQNVQFKVVDTTLPFINFETQTINTGEKYFTGFTPIETFTVTLREDVDFSVYNYFKAWQDSFYNENNEFVALDEGIEKGSENDPIHKQALLTFFSFEEETRELVNFAAGEVIKAFPDVPFGGIASEFMKYKEHFVRPDPQFIVNQEIIQNIITSTVARFKSKAQNFGRKARNLGRRLTGGTVDNTYINPDAPPTRRQIDTIGPFIEFNIDPVRINAIARRVVEYTNAPPKDTREKRKFRERPTQKFEFRNIKLIGFSELSLAYDTGDPLLYTVTLAPDQIIPTE
jgi:hypothetical protein